MHFFARRCLLLALCLLHVFAVLSSARAETAKITFILVNDIYVAGDTLMADGKRRGGFARLAAVVKAERMRGSPVILAHGGDTLSPSLLSGIDKGAHIMALTNMVRPNIFIPGNHEFDFGDAVFLQRMAEARFPIFAANLRTRDGHPLPGFKDREIININGIRIGLTGATYDGTPGTSSPMDLKFLPTVATMEQQTNALRQEGADFVVAVMHADRQQSLDLAAKRVADLVLTGHNHDLFVAYDGRTALVESAYDAQYVTLVDVAIDVNEEHGQRSTTWWPQFRIVDTASVTPDPEVAAAVAAFERDLGRELEAPLCRTEVVLDSRNASVRGGETAIGNLIADAMRDRAHADAAIMNGGGIRGGRLYEPGSVLTRRNVLEELPFGNRLVILEVSGRVLWEAMENGFSQFPMPSGRFPQVSGIEVRIDPHRPPGNRVLAIRIGGAPLEPDRIYRVATNDFLARGGDGYAVFAALKPHLPIADSPLLANEVIDYLRGVGTIRARVEGRIVVQ